MTSVILLSLIHIFQPQSEIWKVRKYLCEHGLVIEEEDMVEEDGKFYPIMRVVHGEPETYEMYEYLSLIHILLLQ